MKQKIIKLFVACLLVLLFKSVSASVIMGGDKSATAHANTTVCPRIEYVIIFWSPFAEVNNDWFRVERTTDPSWSFAQVISGEINSCGTCGGNDYSFADNGPFINGVTYYYRVKALSNSGNYSDHDIGQINFPVLQAVDWKSQVTNEVNIGSTSNNPNDYVWTEESSNITQGVTINLTPTEIMPIYLEQNNSKINFSVQPYSFMNYIEVNIDNQGYTAIYDGSTIQNFIWTNPSALTSTVGDHSLYVNWIHVPSGTIYHREYTVRIVPKSNALFIDNHCNTMRLWEGDDPDNEIPIILSSGFDAYNTKGEQYYRSAGNDLINCLLDKGFKVYVIIYKYNSQNIKNNAATYASAVKYISSINNNQKVIAAGISMGGIIARYALAKAENDGTPLPASKLLTLDSPHQGAVIATDLQEYRKDKTSGDGFAEHASNNPSAKELLTYNAYDPSGGTHNNFYNVELNTLNGDGYPHLTENIAVAFSTPDPNPNSGDWLTINVTPFSGQSETFSLTTDLLAAGSYLPRVNADPVALGFGDYWALNFLIIPQVFLLPTVSITQSSDPTFMYHTSALDIVDGQSKFDVTIIPSVTSYHDVVPGDIIEPLVNALVTDHVYIQNKTITNTRTYIGKKTITAGNNVTNEIPFGDVNIEPGADVTFKAGESIILKPGFHAKTGSIFHAFITTSPVTSCDGTPANQRLIEQNPEVSFVPGKDCKIQVFPNPVHSVLTLRSDNIGVDLIEIIDVYGKVVASYGSLTEINVSACQPGVYIIRAMRTDKQTCTERIVIY